MTDKAPQIKDGEIIQVDGDIVLTNSILTEVYLRLVSERGSYPFDPSFGSDLKSLINQRQLTSAIITNSVVNALRPMVDNGDLLYPPTVEVRRIDSEAKLSINLHPKDSRPETLTLASYAL